MLRLKKNNANLLSFFAGLCFFLSAIELLVPKPLPFFRLGLANLAVILATNILPLALFLLLLIIKVLGQGLISGTLFSYVFFFSLAGTFSSGLVMYALKFVPKKTISYIGISCAGAAFSGVVQLFLSYVFIFGESTFYFAPLFLLLGLITSFFLGVFVNAFVLKSSWYKAVVENKFNFSFGSSCNSSILKSLNVHKKDISNETNGLRKLQKPDEFCNFTTGSDTCKSNRLLQAARLYRSARFRIFVGTFLLAGLFLINNLEVKALLFSATLILCLSEKIKLRVLNILMFAFFIVLFNLFNPSGKVLFEFIGFDITSVALNTGIEKFLIFETLLFISKWVLNCKMSLSGNLGNLISNALFIFKVFSDSKSKIDKKNIILSLDKILIKNTCMEIKSR